jgi:hypothetical protein
MSAIKETQTTDMYSGAAFPKSTRMKTRSKGKLSGQKKSQKSTFNGQGRHPAQPLRADMGLPNLGQVRDAPHCPSDLASSWKSPKAQDFHHPAA